MPKGRSKRFYWGALLLLCLLAGGYYYWQKGEESAPGDAPLIVSVEIGSIENAIASAGSLKPSSYVDVGAQVSGQLEKLHVDVGDLVQEGQLLAEIDARVQANRVEATRASIKALEAQVSARQASLELAKANVARQERLMTENASSQLEYDNAVTTLASAESSLVQLDAQILQNKASLASDETTLEFSKIFAPTSGTVVSLEMNEGRTLNAAQQAPTILRIADLSTMTVETDVSEADVGRLKIGMDVYFTTLGGGERRWYGKLRQILPTPTIENNVVLYTALFDVENADGSLLSEMTAQVFFVESAAKDVLTVPVGALSFLDMPSAGDMAAMRAAMAQKGPPPGSAGEGFRPPNGFSGAFNGNGPGRRGGMGRPGANGAGPARRMATVTVVNDDGSMEEREVMVGVTSRIAAEVISGLSLGEKVVAGILQTGLDMQRDDFDGPPPNFRMMRGF